MNDQTNPHQMAACAGWHPEHVKAAIRAKGCTLAQFAERQGVERSLVGKCIRARKSERIDRAIARFLGVAAHAIWPERYAAPRHRARQEVA